MFQPNVAEGVHRVFDAFVNWYLVEDGGRLTIVDAGTPRSWKLLHQALAQLGKTPQDVEAIVLTHGHYDHVGFAEKARRELGIPVLVHRDDAWLARHPLRFKSERSLLLYAWRPSALRIVGPLLGSRAPFVKGVRDLRTYEDRETLDVPGAPRVVCTPGHTFGHCSLHLPERGVLIAGDAIVTLDPYTGRRGPCLVARAATADSERALASLDRIAETEADTVLSGHGDPWTDGARRAAELARIAGTA
jgi:glyoxylase-like metal-dependent hydrolase (beta-lactamase superfamily II)